MNRFMQKGLCVATALGLWLGIAALAQSEPERFLELWLQYDQGRFTVAQQSVQEGEAPPVRGELFQEGQWLIQAQDAAGSIRYSTAIPDPTTLYSDHLQTGGSVDGLVTGHRGNAASAFFAVSLPYDPRIVRLTIWRLKHSLNADQAAGYSQTRPGQRQRRRRDPINTPTASSVQSIGAVALQVPNA